MSATEGDGPIQGQSLMYLTRGILMGENWQWLSREQLATWYTAITGKPANDRYVSGSDRTTLLQAVRAILREQVRMLEEMVALRWTAEADARGFNVLHELLRDNRRTLGVTDHADEAAAKKKKLHGSKRKANKDATVTSPSSVTIEEIKDGDKAAAAAADEQASKRQKQ
jgi:FKBP-type peptidyl-prolyl cis-trans isomerase